MDAYNLISGLVLIEGGTFAFLAGTGRVEIISNDPSKSKAWREKQGRFMKWTGPAIVVFGVAHLLGIF